MKQPKHITLILSLALVSPLTWAGTDFLDLSLEELMNIEISSAAKKPQRLSDAATAIHVISREDIRRSGATNLPELLRTVPGVQVSRIDASRYAVSIRGFSNRFSGKLLVLLDGRSLYAPQYAGVYWEAQDVLLEDVERIEVIRGPGGTLWGANAVNGVINIISRTAQDTQGSYLEARAGNLESGAAFRHGGRIGDDGNFRVYAKVDDHQNLLTASGQDAFDAWQRQRAGFRVDMAADARDTLTVQGDVYESQPQQLALSTSLTPPATAFVPDTANISGANLLFRWQRAVSESENWYFQAYIDRANLHDVRLIQDVDTLDLEWQHRFRFTPAQELTWGLGYRQVSDVLDGGFTISATPNQLTTQLYSAFLQDEIKLKQDLRLTLGSKIEHNDFTGVEVQPSARLQWRATDTDSVWVAVSRAVQTPSRSNRDIVLNGFVQPANPLGIPLPTVLRINGSADIQSEVLVAGEIGYRGQFGPDLNVDITAFHNSYDKLLSYETGPTVVSSGAIVLNRNTANMMEGATYGLEVAGNWQVTPAWRLHASYSRLAMDLRAKAGGSGTGISSSGSSPEHMAQLNSRHNLGHDLEVDATLYYMDKLPSLAIDSYTRLDLRLGWRPTRDLELSLTAQNLLDNSHPEYTADDVTASQIPRSLLGQLRLKF